CSSRTAHAGRARPGFIRRGARRVRLRRKLTPHTLRRSRDHMELTKRFLFRGNASALSGQIFRPKTVIVDIEGASSLGVSGGRSQAQIKGRAFDEVIRFGSAMTLAEGLYDDEKQARAVTNHKGEPQDLNATTNVVAELRELSVGRQIVFNAKRIRAALVSRSPRDSGEPSIAPAKGVLIQGVDIGGFGLDIAL